MCIQLRSFAEPPHRVPSFLLGRISGLWLYLEEDSGCYFCGTWTCIVDKSQWRYIHDSLPEDIKKIIYEW
jgi:hypothetical protein